MQNPAASKEIEIVSQGERTRVTIQIGTPFEELYEGLPTWCCRVDLPGLHDISKPARGSTSFESLIHAVAGARQLIRDATAGGKQIYDVENQTFVTLKDLFWLH